MPYFRWSAASFSRHRSGFDPSTIHVRSLIDRVSLGHALFWALGWEGLLTTYKAAQKMKQSFIMSYDLTSSFH